MILTNIDRSILINVGSMTMDACVIGNVCANHYVLVCAGLPGCPEQGGESRGQLRLTLVRPGLLPPVTRDDRQLSPTVMIQLVWPFSVQCSAP